jgi:hypothetical protein
VTPDLPHVAFMATTMRLDWILAAAPVIGKSGMKRPIHVVHQVHPMRQRLQSGLFWCIRSKGRRLSFNGAGHTVSGRAVPGQVMAAIGIARHDDVMPPWTASSSRLPRS